jgi:DNA-directed RNA polymerase specialized sigma24 family protein
MTDSPRSKWTLNAEAMERLLRVLSPDREAAGEAYELLRRRLIKFFQWERCLDPEQCADESINRLARRIESGEHIGNVQRYALGVAGLVRMEAQAAGRREAALVSIIEPLIQSDRQDESLDCLDRCLDSLPPGDKDFLLRYYSGSGRERAQRRRELAARFDTSINALRNRALRLREKMERCVRDCVSRHRI